jgi:hypothetical protein
MNLERIVPKGSNYMVLKKISEYKKFYVCVDLNESSQKINDGSNIEAFDFKNIQQFKGLRPFFILNEQAIIDDVEKSGLEFDYKIKLKIYLLIKKIIKMIKIIIK